MSGFSQQRRIDRMNQAFSMNGIISNRAYNLVMGGVLFYGILINIILTLLIFTIKM